MIIPESTKVVDSWAMVAWVQLEPAAPVVRQFLLDADAGNLELLMSWLNVAETFYILAKRTSLAVAEEFLNRLPSLPIRIVLPDEDGSAPNEGVVSGDLPTDLIAPRASPAVQADPRQ